MERAIPRPRLVRTGEAPPVPRRRALPDLGVAALLLAVSALPIAGTVAGVGRWGDGATGLATAVAMLSARALWHEVLDAHRRR